ncbi:MAG: M48 family metalloprotease [Firmicutes bacterium]|nr:M48 family metalloprotease [Bacillota bacterium]
MDKFFRYIIFDMPNGLRLALILLLFLINYGAEFLIKRSVLKVYRKTESAEEAVNKLRIYNQYCLVILQIVTVVPLEFLVVKYFIRYGKTGRIIFMLIAPFTFLMVINVGQLLIINKTYKRIRGTTESLFNQIRDIALTLLLILLPIGVIGTVSSFADGLDIESKALEGIIAAATPITMMILFNLALPFLYPKLLKAVPLEDENLRALLVRLFAKAGMKSAQLYQWPTKEKKVANALVVGVVKPKVFISDYFLENAEPSEVEAIVAHEVGHLKHKHLIKRLLHIVAGICELFLVGFILEWYENQTGQEVNQYLGMAILLVPFLLYISLGLLKYYRKQENQADEFVLNIGIQPEVMISALLKLARLNHMVSKMRKLDERFQTHPSIARRIRQIEKISGYKYDLSL